MLMKEVSCYSTEEAWKDKKLFQFNEKPNLAEGED